MPRFGNQLTNLADNSEREEYSEQHLVPDYSRIDPNTAQILEEIRARRMAEAAERNRREPVPMDISRLSPIAQALLQQRRGMITGR